MTGLLRRWAIPGLIGCMLFLLLAPQARAAEAAGTAVAPATQPAVATHAGDAHDSHGGAINLAWAIPFVLLLACIALMPFIHKHWWEHWYPAVALALGAISASYYFFLSGDAMPWWHEMQEYVSFIILLTALYVVSGGIVIHVGRHNTPMMNTVLLAFGAVIANIFGTTGASMLLIRPFLRMNKGYVKPFHIVFFIFIVSNCGGLLTPIGDPPLFLGYLKGVPFWWMLDNCRWMWIVGVGTLLVVFYVIDRIDHGKVTRHKPEDLGPPVFITGIHNVLLIVMILWGVFQPGMFDAIKVMSHDGVSGKSLLGLAFSREVMMAAAGIISLMVTGKGIYLKNEFTWGPIREVAILFIGIFSTMVPALQWLNYHAKEMPLKTPGQYYFVTGTLSSVLDNAPTYLTFLQVQLGTLDQAHVEQAWEHYKQMSEKKSLDVPKDLPEDVHHALKALTQYHEQQIIAGTLTRDELKVAFLLTHPVYSMYLAAVSLGAVFFGACTYIGNGPNFMVKSIAEASGVEAPSFVGYVVRYTLPILVPIYILVWAIFFLR